MPEKAKVDAVWIDPSLWADPSLKAKQGNQLVHAAEIAGEHFGMKPGQIQVSVTGVDGGLFIRRKPTDPPYLWHEGHPQSKSPRYDWKDEEGRNGKVRLGYLLPEDDEATNGTD